MTRLQKSHRQHAGELAVQQRRGVPPELSAAIVGAIHDEMPHQLVDFYRSLPLIALGTLDAMGRPWVALLCNPETSAPSRERLRVHARVNPADPFVAAVAAREPRPFAGVAIDFMTRRRVKLAGAIDEVVKGPLERTLTLELAANEHMGNCPKYITTRRVRPTRREPSTQPLGVRLSDVAKALLREASTAFVATRHVDADARESDMGLNHRGGPRGFVRYFEDDSGGHLVLPDYSGNRFYQSLGNVETDPVMGLAVPDFKSGALLQVTGRARNVFDDEASLLMPGTSLVTVISIEEAFFTHEALDLELVGEEQLSPYDPPVRALATEAPSDRTPVSLRAKLIDITRESRRISTFTFALAEPIDVAPGGYVILDFSERVARWYQHMNDRHPQSLNDDLVRTFTVSRMTADRRQFSITVKKSGVISSYLHALSLPVEPLELTVKGVGGTFTCFEEGRVLPRMLWVAGGVGITPFLAMYRAIRASGATMPQIELLYACRGDELDLIRELTDLRVQVFDSTSDEPGEPDGMRKVHRRRMVQADVTPLVEGVTVFVCGPPGLQHDVVAWLDGKVEPANLRVEHFEF